MNSMTYVGPDDYVLELHTLKIPDYKGSDGGFVAITRYMSANPSFGGNANGAALRNAISIVAKATKDTSLSGLSGIDRVFTGQGSPDNFRAVLAYLNKYKENFKALPNTVTVNETIDKKTTTKPLASYFNETDFLQAILNIPCLGLDCIGFVGTFLVEAGLNDEYVGLLPLDYSGSFPLVKSLDEVNDGAVVLLTNGQHIQMINEVTARRSGSITVNLCQSSSGGPQTNRGVTITSARGDYLPVEVFRTTRATKHPVETWNRYLATVAKLPADKQGKPAQPSDGGWESFLRKDMTLHGQTTGYKGGAIFQLKNDGDTPNPVGGSVYIGRAPFKLWV